MTYVNRDYQDEAVDAGVAYLTDPKLRGRHGIIVQPTGAGKSLVIAGIATRLGEPTLVFQPSREILLQNAAKLADYGYRAAVFSASLDRRELGNITLATIGSVMNYAEHFARFRHVLVDECHAVNARGGMYDEFLASQDWRIIGLTATPYRLASNSYGSELRFLTRTRPRVFRDVVQQTPIRHLVEHGWWAPLRYEERVAVDRTKLQMNSAGSDYKDESVQQHLFEVGFVGTLQEEVQRQLDAGRKAVLVFTRFVEESRRLALAFPGLAAIVTAETPDAERARILGDFKAGRLRVVSNVGVVALGFDYPALDCVILGRPSISLGLYYQMVGRVVRPHPDKAFATVVDLVGLRKLFGPVEELDLRAPKKDDWAVYAGDRQLTNVYFAQRDAVDPAVAAKATAKRKFWAKRGRGKRGYGYVRR